MMKIAVVVAEAAEMLAAVGLTSWEGLVCFKVRAQGS